MKSQELLLRLAAAGVVGLTSVAAGCGASPKELLNRQAPTPVGVVAVEGDTPPADWLVVPQGEIDEWDLETTTTPLAPTATLSPTVIPTFTQPVATLSPTIAPESTKTPVPTATEAQLPPTPTHTTSPTPTPIPTATETVVVRVERPKREPVPTATRELREPAEPAVDLTPEQWQQLNAATTIANFGTWGYCTGASIDPSGIVGSSIEGAVLVAAHCTKNAAGQRLPPPRIGHPAHMFFESRYLFIDDLLDVVMVAYNTSEGGIAVLPAGNPLAIEEGDTLFTVTYQWDTLHQRGWYESHHVRVTGLRVTGDEIIFADGVDRRADWPYVTGGASTSWLAQVQDGQLKGVGVITAGGDREANPEAYAAYVQDYLGYEVGDWNLGFATRIDRVLEEFEIKR